MARTQVQKFVVGKWEDDSYTGLPESGGDPQEMKTGGRKFVPCDQQPDEPITELNKMVAWTKKAFAQQPGEYAFIREIPGALVCAKQTEFNWSNL